MGCKKCRSLVVVMVCALLALAVGCAESTTTNSNANTANANANINTNANTANANATANANDNRAITREDVTRKKDEYTAEAKRLGRKIGAGANDTWLWVKTRADLAAADDLRDSSIEVDVDNGVITLTGTVASDAQLKRADAIAKGIDGQQGVQNKLKVAAAGSTNANGNANKGGAANANKG